MTFYVLKFSCIFFSLILLVANKNPIYSVLSLVGLFVTGSILLLLLKVDFLPYVFIIVYAGAIAILFLFVVIILKIKSTSKNLTLKQIFFITFFSLFLTLLGYSSSSFEKKINFIINDDLDVNKTDNLKTSYEELIKICLENYKLFDSSSNIQHLGQLLYTEYNIHFIIAGIILLVAIIGAIILTRVNQSKTVSLRQNVFKQKTRSIYIGKYTLIKKK